MKPLSKKTVAFFILFLMILQFSFGFYRIQKEAYVDEALWIYSRIPKFWQNMSEADWKRTKRSDKPGVTLMYVTGIGLLDKEHLINCKKTCNDTQTLEIMLRNLRTPVLLMTALFIPLLFLLLNKLFNQKTALISITLIALSPILLGMSRIINPDAMLWTFTTGTILSYLVYLKNTSSNKFLYLSGILMGLALLTKYVANILFVFILALPFLNYIFTKRKLIIAKYFKEQSLSYLQFIGISILTFSILYPTVWIRPYIILKGTIYSQAFSSTWPFFILLIAMLSTDIFIFNSLLLKKTLPFIRKHSLLLKKILAGIFVVISAVILLNVLIKQPFFNFSDILASPKSSHKSANPLFFFLTNFYPLLFGITPLALIAIFANSIKTIRQKNDPRNNEQNVFFYFLLFIFLYYLASLFSGVAGTIRYQIMLYPIILIMAGISISHFSKQLKNIFVVLLLLLAILIYPLYKIKPYYISYVSSLLPQKYYLDHKDMGNGSYEAAMFLNSLPNAKNLSIWADKKGVCTFFVGKCIANVSTKRIQRDDYDYYVVSSGREKMVSRQFLLRKNKEARNIPYVNLLYSQNNYIHIINLGNRPNNFIKIFPLENVR